MAKGQEEKKKENHGKLRNLISSSHNEAHGSLMGPCIRVASENHVNLLPLGKRINKRGKKKKPKREGK